MSRRPRRVLLWCKACQAHGDHRTDGCPRLEEQPRSARDAAPFLVVLVGCLVVTCLLAALGMSSRPAEPVAAVPSPAPVVTPSPTPTATPTPKPTPKPTRTPSELEVEQAVQEACPPLPSDPPNGYYYRHVIPGDPTFSRKNACDYGLHVSVDVPDFDDDDDVNVPGWLCPTRFC